MAYRGFSLRSSGMLSLTSRRYFTLPWLPKNRNLRFFLTSTGQTREESGHQRGQTAWSTFALLLRASLKISCRLTCFDWQLQFI